MWGSLPTYKIEKLKPKMNTKEKYRSRTLKTKSLGDLSLTTNNDLIGTYLFGTASEF